MDWFIEILRKLAGIIDYGIYSLADIIYRIFSTIANTELINAEEISRFTNRVYVILGVFMLFKIGFSMLKYLVNPDTFTNQNTGYNKLVWNISTALVLLVSMPTIYNYAMRLQNAVISNDVIGKLILGTSGGGNAMETGGKKISFTVLSAFMMPNFDTMKAGGVTCGDLYKVEDNKTSIACVDSLKSAVEDEAAVDQYDTATKESDVKQLIFGEHAPLMAHMTNDIHTKAENSGNYSYFLEYRWGISAIVGLFLCFIFLTFCIDIAIRSIKIAFLMLISPIPILSMINPDKGSKGMLSKWFEMAWATYLDLFLRLASVNFVIYIITRVQTSVWGELVKAANDSIPVAVLAMVFIIIGALLFAKQLPDMIIKLFPMMDGIVKGGFNPLKKLNEAATVATKAPLAGKALGGAMNWAAARAQARDNWRVQKRTEKNVAAARARQEALNAGKSKKDAKTAAKEAMRKVEEEYKSQAKKAEKAASIASVGAEAFDSGWDATSWLGGSAITDGVAGAAAQVRKEGRKVVRKMKADYHDEIVKGEKEKQLRLDQQEAYDKVKQIATAEREVKVKEKTKEIMERENISETAAREKASKEVKLDMDAAAEKAGEGRLYQSQEYADQVARTRVAKDNRNAAQSAYEKASLQLQSEGAIEITDSNGQVRKIAGAEAAKYVDDLRVAYVKAGSEYDFANEDLKKMGEMYPEDAKNKTLYETAKDRIEKGEKIEQRREEREGTTTVQRTTETTQSNGTSIPIYGANGEVISNVQTQQTSQNGTVIYSSNGQVISSGSTNVASGQPNVVNGGTTIVRTDDRNNDEPVGMTRQEVIEQNAAQTGPETNAQRALRQSQVVTQRPIRVVNGGHELGQETSNIIMQVNNVTTEYRQVEQQLNSVTENINTRLRDIENVTAQVASETGATKVAGEQELQRMRADLENMRSKQLDLMKQSEQSLTQVASQMNELRTKITELNDLGRQAEALVLQQQLNDLNDIYNKRTEN